MVEDVGVRWQKISFFAVIEGCGGCLAVESDGADFLAQHTLLQVCRPVASVLVASTTIIAWLRVWECCGEEKLDVRQ